jgi:Mce-associated membrane protein
VTGDPGGTGVDAAPPCELPTPPAAKRARRSRPPWSVVLVALLLAGVSLSIAAGALLIHVPEMERRDSARASALEAARERGAELTTYSHATLDEDFAAVLETATGEFEQEYRTTTDELRPVFEQTQAVAVGEVVAAGLESAQVDGDGPERAVAVLAVDQVIRTTGAPPRTEHNRIRMVLVRPDETWLVERVERL